MLDKTQYDPLSLEFIKICALTWIACLPNAFFGLRDPAKRRMCGRALPDLPLRMGFLKGTDEALAMNSGKEVVVIVAHPRVSHRYNYYVFYVFQVGHIVNIGNNRV